MNLNLNQSNIALAIYGTHTEAESAIKELQQSSFDMNKLSVVGRSHHVDERVLGYYNTGDRMKTWEKVGAFWGEIWGLHSGPAFFCIPGFGHLVFAGPIVSWLTGVLKNAVIMGGTSALEAGLVSMGIPENSIIKCEASLKTDKFVVIVH